MFLLLTLGSVKMLVLLLGMLVHLRFILVGRLETFAAAILLKVMLLVALLVGVGRPYRALWILLP